MLWIARRLDANSVIVIGRLQAPITTALTHFRCISDLDGYGSIGLNLLIECRQRF